MADAKTGISIDDLDALTASETPYEFEAEDPDGNPCGIFLRVLGDQSDTVTAAMNKLVNERRKRDAVAAAKAARSRPDSVDVAPVEDDIEYHRKMAAIRLVGWRRPGETTGLAPEQLERFIPIQDAYTPELALKLVRRYPDFARQCIDRAGQLGNFIKISPKV